MLHCAVLLDTVRLFFSLKIQASVQNFYPKSLALLVLKIILAYLGEKLPRSFIKSVEIFCPVTSSCAFIHF
jgi:hypothetical protein